MTDITTILAHPRWTWPTDGPLVAVRPSTGERGILTGAGRFYGPSGLHTDGRAITLPDIRDLPTRARIWRHLRRRDHAGPMMVPSEANFCDACMGALGAAEDA